MHPFVRAEGSGKAWDEEPAPGTNGGPSAAGGERWPGSLVRGTPEDIDKFRGMTAEDIARIVLCLLAEEMLKRKLAAYREEDKAGTVAGHADR